MLEVWELEKRFYLHRLGREVVAFQGVSFRLKAGEFLLLEGPNGAGKSSLLKVLYRTYRPTAGAIWLQTGQGPLDLAQAGEREVLWARKHWVGYARQFLDPRPRTPALEVAAEPLLWAGLPREEALARARELLLELGLREELLEAFPTAFSGGERQKVNLARIFLRPLPLLLLDEPTASLDPGARKAVRARLWALKEQGVAMVGVFHHPEDVAGLVDRSLRLEVRDVAFRG
ncbi:MAG: ATP-binding cassette domain-containing protein [Thermus sp.]|uniref:ATP-binding cassette domain-containing protein n=1 Tax=Thermus sp. TaxID=275 RepID=UPI00298F32C9|nr:ATP-binding cassette domain-containing protein [Thermus sp.]MDW8018304.1 ATP-binding cassette domain-containing protein [Thermus sp.]